MRFSLRRPRCVSLRVLSDGTTEPCWDVVRSSGHRCEQCLDSILKSADPVHRSLLASEADIDESTLFDLLAVEERAVAMRIVKRDDLSEELQLLLANFKDPIVRRAIAEVTTSIPALARLLQDAEADVASAALTNGNIPEADRLRVAERVAPQKTESLFE